MRTRIRITSKEGAGDMNAFLDDRCVLCAFRKDSGWAVHDIDRGGHPTLVEDATIMQLSAILRTGARRVRHRLAMRERRGTV